MYCTVALSFQSDVKPIKVLLTYKIGEHNVKVNDVVEVLHQHKVVYGVISALVENDTRNLKQLERFTIDRILHTNSIYALVRRRFNAFKDFEYNHRATKRKRLIRKLKKEYGDDYRRKVMKYVCLGNHTEKRGGDLTVWHNNHRLIFRENDRGNYHIVSLELVADFKSVWRTSAKAENYFNKLYEEYYGNS